MKVIQVQKRQSVLEDRKRQAQKMREYFSKRNILCVNLMGSPGAGKTALLEMTAGKLNRKITVVEGDLQTDRDAQRMEAAGFEALQITTGQACHLDIFMMEEALEKLTLEEGQLLFIENVGNLVCPASHDLGAHKNAVVLSVAEGDDKVAKYPAMFQKADVLVLTKTDLTPYIPYNKERVYLDFQKVNAAPIIETSIQNPDIGEWISFLQKSCA